MRLLLDTHILIWSVAQSERLPVNLRDILEDPAHEVFFSAASIWEVAIKHGRNRPDFRLPPDQLDAEARAASYVELPVRSAACSLVSRLAHHHRDPFDRLLVAQAIAASLTLYTADTKLAPYGRCVALVG